MTNSYQSLADKSEIFWISNLESELVIQAVYILCEENYTEVSAAVLGQHQVRYKIFKCLFLHVAELLPVC